MSVAKETPPGATSGGRELGLLAAGAIVSLAPFLVYRGLFSRLYWFGDEFDLIDQIDRLGFWHWVWLAFAENFVPLFKVLWGGSVLVFGGSYAAMITLVWLAHALNVALLGRMMRSAGLSWTAVFFAQFLFGLAPANLETLSWSVQGSSVLSITFMLLAMDAGLRGRGLWRQVAWVALSALSFSRGVVTGPVAALGRLIGAERGRSVRVQTRTRAAAVLLLPSIGVAALIALLAAGNHQHMRGHWAEAALFGLWYLCANPTHTLLSVESLGWHTVAILGLLKMALVVWSLARSTGPLRVLFLMLVAFEIGDAVLLGIGRYHTGLGAALASRYQYASLLGIAPMAGFGFSRLCAAIPGGRAAGRGVAALVLIVSGLALVTAWPTVLEPFTTWRGTQSRRVLLVDPAPRSDAVPGIPAMRMDRARTLIEKYGLH